MKTFQFLIIMLVTGFGACTLEESVVADRVKITLKIEPNKIGTYAPVDAIPGEYYIQNLYIWFFRTLASDTEPAVGYYGKPPPPDSPPAIVMLYLSISELGLPESEGSYDVYILANLPASTQAPPPNTTKAELKALKETQFTRTIANPSISFFAQATYTKGFNIFAYLKRTVAKIDLECFKLGMNSWSFSGVTVENERLTTAYTEGEPASERRTTGFMLENGVDKYRYYLYENPAGVESEMIRLKVKLTDAAQNARYYYALLNDDEGGLIERNKVYSIQLIVSPDDYMYELNP